MGLENKLREIEEQKRAICARMLEPLEIKTNKRWSKDAWQAKLEWMGFFALRTVTYPLAVPYSFAKAVRVNNCGGNEASFINGINFFATLFSPLLLIPSVVFLPKKGKYLQINQEPITEPTNTDDPRINIWGNELGPRQINVLYRDGLHFTYDVKQGYCSMGNGELEYANLPNTKEDDFGIWQKSDSPNRASHLLYSRPMHEADYDRMKKSIRIDPELKDQLNKLIIEQINIRNENKQH